MQTFEYVIIGGGIAGVTAAEAIRARDPHGTIAIVGDELPDFYSRVLLPGYVKGTIKRDQLFLRRGTDFERHTIRCIQATANGVDTIHRIVHTASGSIGFGKLLIASGGRVTQLSHVPVSSERIYHLQTLGDADRLTYNLPNIHRALIIGGGFIALEFIGILKAYNIQTTLLEKDTRLLARFTSKESSGLIENNARAKGVSFIFQDEIIAAEEKENALTVTTKKGNVVKCEALCVGIGIQRSFEFLKTSGINLGAEGVVTNEYLETSVSGVYAAGDVAEFDDGVVGRRRVIGNWNNSFLQGATAGGSMTGERAVFRHVSGYATVCLGMHIAVLGDPRPSSAVRVQPTAKPNAREELFLEDDMVQGAVLINLPEQQARARQLIGQPVGRMQDTTYRQPDAVL